MAARPPDHAFRRREADNGGTGEFELLAKLARKLPEPKGRLRVGVGDDAAITLPGGATATSVDTVVDGVHFQRASATLGQIGHKALATALSDLAAMGAEPGEAYLALGVPPDLSEEDCLELLAGVHDLAAETGTQLAGGDTTRSPVLSLAVTVVGHAARAEDLICRSGAKPGDALLLTGEIGAATAGLRLIQDPELAEAAGLSTERAEALRLRQLLPRPQLAAGLALAGVGARAMIDISDGLGADAGHLARESRVVLEIEMSLVPIAAGVAAVAARLGLEADDLAGGGGEDYELLLALPPESIEDAVSACESLGESLTVIGEVRELGVNDGATGVTLRRGDGSRLMPRGFDQLAG